MNEQVFVNYSKFHIEEDDVEMMQFMKQSLEEQFKSEPKEGKLVILRYPNGKKEQRVFSSQGEV